MDPKDDPEARIRELERSLSDEAAASELGTTASDAGSGRYGPAHYGPAHYGSAHYGSVPPSPSRPVYGAPPAPPSGPYAPPYGSPPPLGIGAGPIAGGLSPRAWGIFLAATLLTPALIAGALSVVFSTRHESAPPPSPTHLPSPSSGRAPGSDPTPTADAGDHLALAGSGVRGKASCSGGDISISGSSNSYVISGSCAGIQVSGTKNRIVLESAEVIAVSGADNYVTYSAGSPTVHHSGRDNVVLKR